ncbi:MAG: ABC transporter substrate-binding protein [Deltaproteobacteria bacterium]|nr:ABC transporter substrate-binding protein [Deltaproteobacteria bacterium]
MNTRRVLFFKASIVTVLFFELMLSPSLGLCVEKTQKGKGQPKTLTIGYIAGMTGFSAGSERVIEQGGHLAVDWINEKGGIDIKGEKYLIKLVTEDHKSTAEGAAGAAMKLIYDQKVKFIVGGIMPFTNVAINSVAEPAKILRAAIYNVVTPDEYGPKTPYTFVTCNGTVEGMITMLTFLAQAHPEVKTIAVSHPDDGAIPFIQPWIVKIAKERGITVLGDVVGFALDTVDFTPLAKKMLARNPDAIGMINGWPSMTGGVLKVARQSGYTKPIFITTYQPAEDTLKVAGKEASTLFYQHSLLPGDSHNPQIVDELMRRCQTKFNHSHIYYIIVGFNNLWMLAQAIEAAQSLDSTTVRDKWEKMNTMKSVLGTAHLGGLKTYGIKHTMSYPIPIISYVNGVPKTMKLMDVTAP